jgi:L-Ala-D/L-Glu epimerase
MLTWTIEPKTLHLKYTWKISRNATDSKTNLIVRVRDETAEGAGEAAPNVRYNETSEKCLAEFQKFILSGPETIESSDQLISLIAKSEVSNALSFAIESAFIHYKSAKLKIPVNEILGVPFCEKAETSYTIPIMDPGVIKAFYIENNLDRFKYIKLKINNEEPAESIKYLLTFCKGQLMVDANEAFTNVEECIKWIEKIRRLPLVFIEQPLPSQMTEESQYMKKYCPFTLFADEAVTNHADCRLLKKSFDGINMKLMKAGGYIRGKEILQDARKNSMQTMIGCMVETTLGISSALNLCALADYADLDSFMLVKDEPFQLLTENQGTIMRAPGNGKSI